MPFRKLAAALSLAAGLSAPAAGSTPVPHTFTPGTPARAAEVNANFQAVVGQVAAAMPSGAVLAFAGATPPPGFLLCDGAEVSRETYKALFDVIGTAYGEGDGSTTFKLPDLRGEFVRGLDAGRGADPEPGRALGSGQGASLAAHRHAIPGAGAVWPGSGGETLTTADRWDDHASVQRTTGQGLWDQAGETRPRNVALHYLIKT
jgi:microcystin-dependent protein